MIKYLKKTFALNLAIITIILYTIIVINVMIHIMGILVAFRIVDVIMMNYMNNLDVMNAKKVISNLLKAVLLALRKIKDVKNVQCQIIILNAKNALMDII